MKKVAYGFCGLFMIASVVFGVVSTVRLNYLEQHVLDLQNATNATAGGMETLANAYKAEGDRPAKMGDLHGLTASMAHNRVNY